MEKRKSTLWSSRNSLLFFILLVGILLISVGMFYSSFALLEPIESVTFSSENLNFENREPGAWQIKKSARWVSPGKAQVTLDLNSILVDSPSNVDIILALDVSSTMSGERLDTLKESVLQLINTLLENPENRIALITFSSSSTICSYLTNDIAALTDLVNSLTASGDTNYYDALVNVDLVLQNSDREDGKNCTVVFLTDGYPPEYNYNFAVSYSNYLKANYPGLIIQGISYELDGFPVGQLKNIANHVYHATTQNLYEILFDATIISETYDEFIITDFIDTNYFNVEHVSSSGGSILNNKENIVWNVRSTGRSYLQTGSDAQLTIKLSVKEEHLNNIVFPVGEKTVISSKINGTLENVESSDTPVLKDTYTVTYDINIPIECSTINFPDFVDYKVFDKVEILDSNFSCSGYIFKKWEIISDKEVEIKNDIFIMPESDVTIRATWNKTTLTKSMVGDIYVAPPSVMQSAVSDEIWGYKDSITKVIFQKGFSDVGTVFRQFDLSDANDSSIVAKMVSTGSGTYTVYIQAENGIQANPNSSNFFNEFKKLERIEGLEIVDTSEVIDMSYMFGWCESLKYMNLQNFNTSKVTTMLNMFRDNIQLEHLDVTSFDTSNVTTMQWMFGGTSHLSELDLSNFNTSKVVDMTAMFAGTGLVNLDISNFDTENVQTMRVMFSNANNLLYLNLDPIKFSTLNVTNMSNMFNNCFNLSTSIVIRNQNITSANFASMFSHAATVSEAHIIVNYVSSNTQAIAAKMISTKSSDAHVHLGSHIADNQIPKISIVGNNDIRSINNVYGSSKLISISSKYQIVSFAVNGVSYTRNDFNIPFTGAEITDIVVEEIGVMQSTASGIFSLSNIMYDQRVYEGATSLQVEVKKEFNYTTTRYLELYDSNNNLVRKNPTGTFTIPGNTIRTKFEFGSEGGATSATSYSYKITITPIYE